MVPVRRAPAGLNATSEETLRAFVLAAVRQPPAEEPQVRPPLLGPFMTYDVLGRVQNILRTLDDNARSGLGLQPALGKVVAALTGRPPLDFETSRHAGNYITRDLHHWDARFKKTRGVSPAWKREARQKEMKEQIWVCAWGCTPDHPEESVLCADLPQQLQPDLVTVRGREGRRRHE